jgi:hypothetical protein
MNFDKDAIKNFIKNDEILSKLDDPSIDGFISSMNDLSPEDIQNFLNYQKTLLSMGYPSCKILMTDLLKNSKCADLEVKSNFVNYIETNIHVEKVAGMNIEYVDTETNKKTYCYIIMNKCDKDHHILPQLEKIQKFFNEEQWKDILKNISMLIYICRNIYKLTILNCHEHIFNLGYDINDIDELKVDHDKMTLYLYEEWAERVGIYIMRECDLEEEEKEQVDSMKSTNIEIGNNEVVDTNEVVNTNEVVDTEIDANID